VNAIHPASWDAPRELFVTCARDDFVKVPAQLRLDISLYLHGPEILQ
jgi:hypothetical protein